MYHVRSLGEDVYVCDGSDPLWECPDPGTTCCMTGLAYGTCLPTVECAMIYEYCNSEEGSWTKDCGGPGYPPSQPTQPAPVESPLPVVGGGQPLPSGRATSPSREPSTALSPAKSLTNNEKLMVVGAATLSILGLMFIARG